MYMSKNLSLTDREIDVLYNLLTAVISDYSANTIVGQLANTNSINNMDDVKHKLIKLMHKGMHYR